tara:strand:+ start:1632 stop:2966 length:1335 start_codon:yes stop_codon:yes gene_type:complete
MNIAVIGSGYVGLITGLCLAEKGHNVRCIDINKNVVDKINKGIPNFYEDGLEILLNTQLKSKRFFAFTKLSSLDIDIEIIIIAVGTPSNKEGDIDLSYIKNVSLDIGRFLKETNNFISIVVKSTVLPRTTDEYIRKFIEEESLKAFGQFGLGMNPEFLREGSAIYDFMNPDRIIIGYEDQETKFKLEKLYENWDCEKLFVNSRTAEFIKYTNNCFLALQISAANELANLAFEIGKVDIEEILHGVHLDKRWNPIINGKRVNPGILQYLKAGPGFGGSCFPKDVKAIRNLGQKKGINMRILDSIIEINDKQPLKVFEIINNIKNLNKSKLLFLGLSFKENTDDVRESPALKIIPKLKNKTKKIFAHDPFAIENFKRELILFENLEYTENWENKVFLSNVIVVLTRWKEYKKLEAMDLKDKIIIDPRRLLDKTKINSKEYLSVGLN